MNNEQYGTPNNKANQWQLAQIDEKIKQAEGSRRNGVILMVISLFFLWPLLIVGIIIYHNANKEIERLNDEKKALMFNNWNVGSGNM